jgi:23S rRNA (adenine2030-N6)-methyltransferase
LLAQALLPEHARLVLRERDPAAFARLEAELASDPRVRLHREDGLADLAREVASVEATADAVVVLIDPSYSQKEDWRVVTKALGALALESTRASIVLWYPVKSLTRPNAMRAELEAAGISGTLAELVTTPLEHKRNRLNGSGVVLIRPPDGLLPALAGAAAEIGPRCATREGAWSFRMVSWRGR